ncbi:hypothetical protein Sa4125_30100 [Aureimonas sp. SA4125]|uniref:hypothetical protein n=1 Tax=Aureimonas sp. SA4125 TaxID=2826993 RepID=UPI001CC3719E|nr:hypothetical protein [Aureimonas sp. SA4125]BDA85468.1 hypothetical protein Sa4125_30100 [Aureimonas sp. SA4125]
MGDTPKDTTEPDGIVVLGPYSTRLREVRLGPVVSVGDWTRAKNPDAVRTFGAGENDVAMPPVYVLRDGWVDQAAEAILDDLGSRSGIGDSLDAVDDEIRAEIMQDIRQSIMTAMSAKGREFDTGCPKIDWMALSRKWANDGIEEPGGIMAGGYLMRLTPEERAAEMAWHHRVTSLADATPEERQAVESEWGNRVNAFNGTDQGAA